MWCWSTRSPAGSPAEPCSKVGRGGCGGSPTRQISVAIPAGITRARAAPAQAGLDARGAARHAGPAHHRHGRRTITARRCASPGQPKQRTTTCPTPGHDEFAMVGQLPDRDGAMYWPVSQVCEEGRTDWVEVPKPGQKLQTSAPAALLDIPARRGDVGPQSLNRQREPAMNKFFQTTALIAFWRRAPSRRPPPSRPKVPGPVPACPARRVHALHETHRQDGAGW